MPEPNLSELRIPRGSVAGELSRRLIDMIERGEFPQGSKLPNERMLAEATGLSRTTVREALLDLELRGIVSRVRGRGTVVQQTSRPLIESSLLGEMSDSERVLREVMDLRSVIEPSIAARAAQRARPADLEALGGPLALAEAELRRPQPSIQLLVHLDVEFHNRVAELTHNPMLLQLMQVANEWMAPSRDEIHQTHSRLENSIRGHRAIFDSIAAHDAVEAARQMEQHLLQVSQSIGVDAWVRDSQEDSDDTQQDQGGSINAPS